MQKDKEFISSAFGVIRDFDVPKINGIEVYGYNDKKLKFGNIDPCPFVTKIETYLELIKTEYEKKESSESKAPRKTLPYLNYKGTCVTRSAEIINYLRSHEIDLDSNIEFSPFQNTLMYLLTNVLEQSFYFNCLHELYLNDDQWENTKKELEEEKGKLFTALSTPFKKAHVRNILDIQGYGKLPPEQIVDKGLLEAQCIEDCLGLYGEGPFFMGNQVSTMDVTIFAFFVPFFKMHHEWKLSRLFKNIVPDKFPKIFSLCEAIYGRVVIVEAEQERTRTTTIIADEKIKSVLGKDKEKETVHTTIQTTHNPKRSPTIKVERTVFNEKLDSAEYKQENI